MRPRGVWQVGVTWVFTVFWLAVVISFSVLTLGFAKPVAARLLGLWGRTVLRLARLRLVVENPEAIAPPEPRVVTFNHGSLLDTAIVTAVFTPRSTAAIKRDVVWYPGIGLALWLVGFLFVDRARPGRARAMLWKTAQNLVGRRLTVFIAPEGTRTTTGDLLPFKKGPYALAIDAQIPVVPLCIDNIIELHPMGRFVSTPGTIRVRFGPPRPTTGLAIEDAEKETTALREWYVVETAKMKAERVGATDAP